MATSVLSTTNITLPSKVADGILTKARDASVIQMLSSSTPQTFGDVSNILFTKEPEAEFVGEGEAHGSMSAEFKPIQGITKKTHVTVRFSDEVTWADEDNQLKIIESVEDAAASALGRALDYAVIHGLNPASGTALAGVNGLAKQAKVRCTQKNSRPIMAHMQGNTTSSSVLEGEVFAVTSKYFWPF